jgi:hypothetical protein
LLKDAVAMIIPDLISLVHLAPLVTRLQN